MTPNNNKHIIVVGVVEDVGEIQTFPSGFSVRRVTVRESEYSVFSLDYCRDAAATPPEVGAHVDVEVEVSSRLSKSGRIFPSLRAVSTHIATPAEPADAQQSPAPSPTASAADVQQPNNLELPF